MLKPPIPADEATRLAALHAMNILDTPAEERFDRITRIALRLFNVPIAVVSLTDTNRQWFKSCYGLDASESARDVSFCGHAILQDQIFIIEDALQDERFADNPAVVGEPYVRFYAGQPLQALNGSRVGTLCIVDRVPRQITATDIATLQDLAKLIENELNSTALNLVLQSQQELAQALHEQKEFTTNLLENSATGAVVINTQHQVIFWNKAVAEMTGIAAKEVLGTDKHQLAFYGERRPGLGDIIIDSRYDQLPQLYTDYKLIDSPTKRTLHAERWFNFKGVDRYIVFEANPVFNAKGELLAAITTLQDFTERERANEALLYSETRLRLILDTMQTGVVVFDRQGQIVTHNQAALNLLCVTIDQIEGRAAYDPNWHLISEDGTIIDLANKNLIRQVFASGQAVTNQVVGIFNITQQNYNWLVINAQPQFDLDGKVLQVIMTHTDITRRKEAELALRESQAQLQDVFDNGTDLVQGVWTDGRFSYVNRAWRETFGYSEEEIPHLTIYDIIHPTNHAHVRELFRLAVKGVQMKNEEMLCLTKAGQAVWMAGSITCSFTNGKLTLTRSIFRDISKSKEAEQQLITAREAALEASRLKSEFLASMSHEIRTPMNAIIGLADLLWETPLSPEQKEYVTIFRQAGNTLLGLINDILDLSKIEAGHLELEAIDFELGDLLEKTIEVLAIQAHEKGLELITYIDKEVPHYLVGDPGRLRQILVNLVGNAIKFTEQGEVVLRVELDSQSADLATLRFMVKDTGIGIPANKLETVFQSFSQADSSTIRKYGGTGLGLTISKRLVALMEGQIWVKSELAHGSIFYFTANLKLQPAPKLTQTAQKQNVPLAGTRVLVVDDSATNRLILREILMVHGMDVTSASDGAEALAILEAARQNQTSFQLILLDSRMPEIDGFEVAEHIKNRPSLTTATIMMLTSDNRHNDVKRAREIGLASYLVKPIKHTELLQAIQQALASSAVAAPSLPQLDSSLPLPLPLAKPEIIEQPLRILLVEDSSDNRLLIKVYLGKTPHQLDMVENGEEAVAKFKTAKYDLVLMDMQMPIMDGYTATRQIREWEQIQTQSPVPIVALTAFALKEEAQKSLDAGCNAHITKPIKKATLLQTVSEYAQFLI
jgi:PAS domain S-box-containing protein